MSDWRSFLWGVAWFALAIGAGVVIGAFAV